MARFKVIVFLVTASIGYGCAPAQSGSNIHEPGINIPSVSGVSMIQAPPVNAPLSFTISGMGNHVRHVCIPALKTLKIRIRPNINLAPLFPAGTKGYDGLPASYAQLQATVLLAGMTQYPDDTRFLLEAVTGGDSRIVDYSDYLVKDGVPAQSVPVSPKLPSPEYSDFLFGSSPTDGLCSFWEFHLKKCSEISPALRLSEFAGCPSGMQKVLLTNIIDENGVVLDYQQWSVTLEAATEDTQDLQ